MNKKEKIIGFCVELRSRYTKNHNTPEAALEDAISRWAYDWGNTNEKWTQTPALFTVAYDPQAKANLMSHVCTFKCDMRQTHGWNIGRYLVEIRDIFGEVIATGEPHPSDIMGLLKAYFERHPLESLVNRKVAAIKDGSYYRL
jgi:hypothetical protein